MKRREKAAGLMGLESFSQIGAESVVELVSKCRKIRMPIAVILKCSEMN